MSTAHDNEDLNALENALRDLQPRPTLARDQLLFAAGRASIPSRGLWPHLSACLGLVVVVLSGWQVFKPAPPIQVVYVPTPTSRVDAGYPSEPAVIGTGDYLRQRQEYLEHGIDKPRRGGGEADIETSGTILTPAARFHID